MKIGMYDKINSLLWDNGSDRDAQEAIRELRFKKNAVSRLVIRLEGTPTYATKELIGWFMNQRFSIGEQFTHRLNENGKMILQTRKKTYKYRAWVPSMLLLWDGDRVIMHPGLHLENTKIGTSMEKKQYYALKDTMKWVPPYEKKIVSDRTNFTMYEPLLHAYELDDNDAAFDILDYYIQQKFQITRLPFDNETYGWFCDLGIAPRFSSLEEPNIIYDEEKVTYIGKEAMLDDERMDLEEADMEYAY